MQSLFLGRLLALHEQYPALYCRAKGDIRRQKGQNETYIGRTSRVVLDRCQPWPQAQPLRRIEITRLGGGDHTDNERPVCFRQRMSHIWVDKRFFTLLLTWPPWRLMRGCRLSFELRWLLPGRASILSVIRSQSCDLVTSSLVTIPGGGRAPDRACLPLLLHPPTDGILNVKPLLFTFNP